MLLTCYMHALIDLFIGLGVVVIIGVNNSFVIDCIHHGMHTKYYVILQGSVGCLRSFGVFFQIW